MWGTRPEGYGKWGYTANLPPYSPRYQKTGHPADIFDGDSTTGYVWKTVSLTGDNCPADSTNCKTAVLGNEHLTIYNQLEGGRKCYGCQGVAACANEDFTVSPLCANAV